MLRRLNKKGQSTGEYAIVFAIVLGAVIAMQTLVRRHLQEGLKGGGDYLVFRTYHELGMEDDLSGDPQYIIRESRQETEVQPAERTVKYQKGAFDYEIDMGDATLPGEAFTSKAGSYTLYEFEPPVKK